MFVFLILSYIFFFIDFNRKIKVICASQSFDVDKKIRDLADDMFLLQKKFRVFSYGKRILKILDITEATGDSESRIVDNLKFDSIFWFWAGSRTLTFIPAWTKYFNTFAAPQLGAKDFPVVPMPAAAPLSLDNKNEEP